MRVPRKGGFRAYVEGRFIFLPPYFREKIEWKMSLYEIKKFQNTIYLSISYAQSMRCSPFCLFLCFFLRVASSQPHPLSSSLSFSTFISMSSSPLCISLPLYFYLCVLIHFNRLLFVIYNESILNSVVILPNNIMYRFFKWNVSKF